MTPTLTVKHATENNTRETTLDEVFLEALELSRDGVTEIEIQEDALLTYLEAHPEFIVHITEAYKLAFVESWDYDIQEKPPVEQTENALVIHADSVDSLLSTYYQNAHLPYVIGHIAESGKNVLIVRYLPETQQGFAGMSKVKGSHAREIVQHDFDFYMVYSFYHPLVEVSIANSIWTHDGDETSGTHYAFNFPSGTVQYTHMAEQEALQFIKKTESDFKVLAS